LEPIRPGQSSLAKCTEVLYYQYLMEYDWMNLTPVTKVNSCFNAMA